jgi:hypothetical protein
MRGRLTMLLLAPLGALALAILIAGEAHAAGTVGSGTAASCDEAAFDTAFAGGGAVTFDCGADPVTITFTGTKVPTADTTIDGGGLVTISGGDTVQLFSTNGNDLVFTNLTLRDAFVGGLGRGAVVDATNAIVAVAQSTVVDNVANFQGGAFSISANDGGEARLVIIASTIANNSTIAAAGGAIFAEAIGSGDPCPPGDSIVSTLFLNSTFTGNSGSGIGQVMFMDADDEVCPAVGEALIFYSTLGDDALSTPTLYFNGNSGGEIGASIMGPNANCGGSIPIKPTSLGYNVVSDAQCFTTTTGDVVGDPLVGPLANNGGPTQTRALLTGSPAIDLVPPGTLECNQDLTQDQRAEARPQGTNCDAGAYESAVLTDTALPASVPGFGSSAAALLLGLFVVAVGLGGLRTRARRA